MCKYLILFSVFLINIACSSDNIGVLYENDTIKYSFSNNQHNIDLVVEQAGVLEIPIYRTSSKGRSTVAVNLIASSDISTLFRLDNEIVVFEDGSSVAYALVFYPSVETLDPINVYRFNLIISSKVVSASNINDLYIRARRKLEYVGEGVFKSAIFEQERKQPIYKLKASNTYVLTNLYVNEYDFIFELSADNTVIFLEQATGFDDKPYGMLYFSPYNNAGELHQSNVDGKKIKFNGTFFNDEVTYGDYSETLVLP